MIAQRLVAFVLRAVGGTVTRITAESSAASVSAALPIPAVTAASTGRWRIVGLRADYRADRFVGGREVHVRGNEAVRVGVAQVVEEVDDDLINDGFSSPL